MTLTFVDSIQTTMETQSPVYGNPLPAGVFCSISEVGSSEVVASGYIQIGGTLVVSLTEDTSYTALFVGTQGPTTSVAFLCSGTDQSIVVPKYASPVASTTGYAYRQTSKWPRNWSSDASKTSAGVMYWVGYGASAEMLDLSQQQQQALLLARVQSSAGTDIDSWFADFFGSRLPRFDGETDSAYLARGEAVLQARRGTPPGVALIASYYATDDEVSILEPFQPAQVGGTGLAALATGQPTGGVGSMEPNPMVYLKGPLANGTSSQAMSMLLASRACGVNLHVFTVEDGIATPLSA